MAEPVGPGAVAAKAAASYRNRRSRWIASPTLAAGDPVTIALHPPTERRVAADPDAAVAWVRAWRSRRGPGTVDWEERRWRSYGTQTVPVRLTLTGAEQVADAAGAAREWRTIVRRREALAAVTAGAPALPAALGRTASRWSSLAEKDFDALTAVLRWLRENPSSGLYIRQLPIPGVDTKWVTGHRGLLEELLRGMTDDGGPDGYGAEGVAVGLGVRTVPRECGIAVCDRALLPGAPRIFAASLDELAALPLHPGRVLMLENKEGLYALPPLTDTVAVHGGGYAVPELAALPWMREAETWYWGDLDTHGFAILDRLRAHLPAVRSLLMDADTLTRWSGLAVHEPSPAARDGLDRLTGGETAAFELLRGGGLRLEQERIPWPWVMQRLREHWRLG